MEPIRATLIRNFGIAIVVGGLLAWRFSHLSVFPIAAALVLWFTLGGHYVEVFFLTWVRPRVRQSRGIQSVARLATWFVGGALLGVGVVLTAQLHPATRRLGFPAWWAFGLAFIVLELVTHVGLARRRQPNFYGAQ